MENEDVFRQIDSLVSYGVVCGLLPDEERFYSTNLILDLLKLDKYDGLFERFDEEISDELKKTPNDTLQTILEPLVSYAVGKGIVEDSIPLKDIFDSKLMNALTPRPTTVIEKFWEKYEESPYRATLDYFRFSKNTNYIRRDRIARDERWSGKTKYGDIQILISLSKPELDPKDIAAARVAGNTGYPKCALCAENEGYAGRENHRIVPFKLCGEDFSLQFSPYRYCHQHCIVLNKRHIPMVVNEGSIRKLLEFITMFPHYFLGSNADLPYVGGSVLSHDHFQGGVHRLPIMDASVDRVFLKSDSVEVSSLFWPLSTVRIKGKNRTEVGDIASRIIKKWRDGYCDKQAGIDPGTPDEPHNTVAPLGYREGEDYVVFLMLRNNKRTEDRPDGMFHTHPDRFHIKKEGIGIIDAPGLAILPPRLKRELELVKEVLLGKKNAEDCPEIAKHIKWMKEIKERHKFIDKTSIDEILHNEVVDVFVQMLEDCGVFKQTTEGKELFAKFINYALCSNDSLQD